MMSNKLSYWIKWENEMPKRFIIENMEEFYHRLRIEFFKHPRILEWMIRE